MQQFIFFCTLLVKISYSNMLDIPYVQSNIKHYKNPIYIYSININCPTLDYVMPARFNLTAECVSKRCCNVPHMSNTAQSEHVPNL